MKYLFFLHSKRRGSNFRPLLVWVRVTDLWGDTGLDRYKFIQSGTIQHQSAFIVLESLFLSIMMCSLPLSQCALSQFLALRPLPLSHCALSVSCTMPSPSLMWSLSQMHPCFGGDAIRLTHQQKRDLLLAMLGMEFRGFLACPPSMSLIFQDSAPILDTCSRAWVLLNKLAGSQASIWHHT